MLDTFCEYDDSALRDIIYVLSSNNSGRENRTISLFARKINFFFKFLKDEMETRLLEYLRPEELNSYLLKYLSQLRKQNTYSKKKWCLRNVFSAISMYLKCRNYSVDISLSDNFVQCRSFLSRWEGFLGQQRTSGKLPVHTLTEEEVKKLFDDRIIGIHSPVALQNFICVICVCLGLKSGKHLRQINYHHLIVHFDKERGCKYVKLYCHGRDGRRLWQNTSDVGRCAVTAVELYKSKRPTTLENILFPLFVSCNITYRRYPAAHPVSEDSRWPWYLPEYIRVGSINYFVKKMMKEAGLYSDGKIITSRTLMAKHVKYFIQSDELPEDQVPDLISIAQTPPPTVDLKEDKRSCKIAQHPSHQVSITQPNISEAPNPSEELPTVRLAEFQTNIPCTPTFQGTSEPLTPTSLHSEPARPPPSFLEFLNAPPENHSALYDYSELSSVPIVRPDRPTVSEHSGEPPEIIVEPIPIIVEPIPIIAEPIPIIAEPIPIIAEPIQNFSSSGITTGERSSKIRTSLEPLPKLHPRPYPFIGPTLPVTNHKNREIYPHYEHGFVTPQPVLETPTHPLASAPNLLVNGRESWSQMNAMGQLESYPFSSLPLAPPTYQSTPPTIIDMLQSPLQVDNEATTMPLEVYNPDTTMPLQVYNQATTMPLPPSLPSHCPPYNTDSSLSFNPYDRSSRKYTSIPVSSQVLVPTITTTYFNHYTNSYWYHNVRASNISTGAQTESTPNTSSTLSTQTDFQNSTSSSFTCSTQTDFQTSSSITQTYPISVNPLLDKGSQCCRGGQTEYEGRKVDSATSMPSPSIIRTPLASVPSSSFLPSSMRAYKRTMPHLHLPHALRDTSPLTRLQLPLIEASGNVLVCQDNTQVIDGQHMFHLFPIKSAHAFIQQNGTREVAIQQARIKDLYVQPRADQFHECPGKDIWTDDV